MRSKSIFTVLFFAAFGLSSQQLARRPLLGVMLKTVDKEIARTAGLSEAKGVQVQSVIPNSTAEKAGIKSGDIILKINDYETNSAGETVKYVAGSSGGNPFTYELLRTGKKIEGRSEFEPMPLEKYEGIEMEYTAVNTVNGLQRLIVSRPPDQKKHPAIIFIGGYGCYSLDSPFEKERSEVMLLNKLTREGYVCVRAEKPGVGDNRNCTPCNEVSFNNEISGYVSAIDQVKKYDYVDSTKVYILGHSMGGVMAPVIAGQTSLKGIIAYGTIGCSFIEHLAKTRRTVAKALEMQPAETETFIKDFCECTVYYFAEGMSTEQATQKKAACAEHLEVFDLRSRAYSDELYALNIAGAWGKYKGEVLLMWGESDFIAAKEDHEIIAEAVNHNNKGKAKFVAVKAATHGMTKAASFIEARNPDGRYNSEVDRAILHWLKTTG